MATPPKNRERAIAEDVENMPPGVGVTKPIFSVPLFSHFFRMIKTVVTCMISGSYLGGVATAELRRHLANMYMIEIIRLYFRYIKISVTEKLAEL